MLLYKYFDFTGRSAYIRLLPSSYSEHGWMESVCEWKVHVVVCIVSGSRYVSWLPSFSVEVTHTSLLPGQQIHHTSQLDNMVSVSYLVFMW